MTYFKTILFFLLISFFSSMSSASIVRINDFRFSTVNNNNIRLVFDASGPVNYSAQEYPKKIIIKIKNATLIGLLNKTWLYKTHISSIHDKKIGNNLQIVVNFKKPLKIKHYVLKHPYRLVIDTIPVVMSNRRVTNINNLRDVVVVIDPGHGGKDPGAIGFHGTHEKTIALSVAKILQKEINKNEGFSAVLTRKGDYFISLRERLGIAYHYKADMFIAVHADAYYRYRKPHGASIFALSQGGATSEAARWLAQKENESELGKAITDKNELLKSVLIDLAQSATISASLEIGDMILQELKHITYLHSSNIEQAAFVVLKSPDIPSLLIETGFISDKHEEMKLRNVKYQKQLANCLATGIIKYFTYRPPKGTYLSKNKNNVL